MPFSIDNDIAHLPRAFGNPTLWLASMRQLLNLAAVDTVANPRVYAQGMTAYMDALEKEPTEYGPQATRPFVRFLELLDKKGEDLFFVGDAREEHDQWLTNTESVFLHLTNSSARRNIFASAIVDHQWNPLPLLERCQAQWIILEGNPSMDFVFQLRAIVEHAIGNLGYVPLLDSPLLHGVWRLCEIHDAPASSENEDDVTEKIQTFVRLFPSSIGGAMEHFYEENEHNILPEMQDDIARMDLTFAQDEGLDILLRVMLDWQEEGSSAWDIVADKHPLFAQSLQVHAGLGYTSNKEGIEILKGLWHEFGVKPGSPLALDLPALEAEEHALR